VANPSKRRGDRAELEVQGLLRELLGVPARRALGAGRFDDIGDMWGIPRTCIQVADRPSDTLRAVREKPLECDGQFARARAADPSIDFAATFIRLRGGEYRVVLTPEQWAAMWREAVS
jgi:hypothetical protein